MRHGEYSVDINDFDYMPDKPVHVHKTILCINIL